VLLTIFVIVINTFPFLLRLGELYFLRKVTVIRSFSHLRVYGLDVSVRHPKLKNFYLLTAQVTMSNVPFTRVRRLF